MSDDVQNDGVLMRLAGWTQAPQWYAYDPTSDKVTNTNLEPLNPEDFSGISSVEVTAPGADGTPIPLSIIYKKDLKMDGQNPCLMEGYGAYGISIDPYFSSTRLALLEKGIVIAYAHVRGGGENGEDWHLAAQKLTKQNTISDFIGVRGVPGKERLHLAVKACRTWGERGRNHDRRSTNAAAGLIRVGRLRSGHDESAALREWPERGGQCSRIRFGEGPGWIQGTLCDGFV